MLGAGRALFATTLRIGMDGIRFALDFLVEDRCVLCGGGDSAACGVDLIEDPRLRALLTPVPVRWLPHFAIINHPLCVCCVRRFEVTTQSGLLGRVMADGGVETRLGDRFGPGQRDDVGEAVGDDADAAGIPLHAPFMTTEALLQVVHRYKFSLYRELALPLGLAVAAAGAPLQTGETVLLPVPMRRGDRKARGMDAVGLLADVIEAETGMDVVLDGLEKVGGARQSLTPNERRASNARGAFICRKEVVADKRVILLDDLVTTGSTAASACAEILASGARSVEVLCLARAV
jgi:predicted amidophosphoribosyltransferase